MLSVIIPAANEEALIGRCLTALFASAPVGVAVEAVVVANGCRDRTAQVAEAMTGQARAAGWQLTVRDLAQGGKPGALNVGDATARGTMLAYLDADVLVRPELMAAMVRVLARDAPVYVSGTPVIPRADSAVTRAYARFWQRLPFAQDNAPGYGLFAVNAAGRARWGAFPQIISDDTFVRLQFLPGERVQVQPGYEWPMAEGARALVRVRRRQDAGVAEIARLWPDLPDRDARPSLSPTALAGLALRDPAGFATYAAISLAVRLGRARGWDRGR